MVPSKTPNTGCNRQKVIIISSLSLLVILLLFWKNNNNFTGDFLVQPNPSTIQYSTEQLLELKNGTCSKGKRPLQNDWIKYQFDEFLEVYNKRPADTNTYGTKITHQFALWCFIRHLQPEFIVESGIYLGLGSWMIRQAAPAAKIIFLDPVANNRLVYEDKINSVYLTGKKFVDFKQVTWNALVEPSKTLIFFDDHQDHNDRLRAAAQWGFKHVMFDDNYYKNGDVFSSKMGCFAVLDINKSEVYHNGKLIEIAKIQRYTTDFREIFDSHVEVYYEFPMLWNSTSASTNPGNKNFLYPDDTGLNKVKKVLKKIPSSKDLGAYYNIVYIRLQ